MTLREDIRLPQPKPWAKVLVGPAKLWVKARNQAWWEPKTRSQATRRNPTRALRLRRDRNHGDVPDEIAQHRKPNPERKSSNVLRRRFARITAIKKKNRPGAAIYKSRLISPIFG